MSYTGYNQYSPYWQHTPGQTTAQNAGHNVGQSRASYQPLSAYQNNQQQSQSSISQPAGNAGSAYGSPGYGNVNMNEARNGRSQESRVGYTNANDRASIDGATALGNLAYASSLGRDGSLSNTNRHQSNTNYGTASSYGVASAPLIQYRTGDEQRDSTGFSKEDYTRSQTATASPSFGYSANNTGYQGSSVGSNTQGQSQYSQSSRFPTEQHQNQYSQPSRPTSGQAIQQSHSRLGSQAASSPTPSMNRDTPNQAQLSKSSGSVRGNEQTKVQTPQSDKRPSSSQAPRESTQPSQLSQANVKSPVQSAAKRTAAVASARETAAKRINEIRQSPAVDSRRDQASKPATSGESEYTTVDPSQVFNHIEYSRRQAAAAAEAAAVKKATEEAEAARIASTQLKPALQQANGIEPESAKKDQMELEMKQMIEKMRDYKAKDPSLFTQIWEQVKKSQPPQRAPSQPLRGSAKSSIVVNDQSPSPSLLQNQLPPESDLPAGDEFPPGFDRGRFPAQRRRRGGKMTPTRRTTGTPKASAEPAADNQTVGDHKSPVPPEIAIPTPKVGQIFPDPGSQSMQQALQQFHQNSKSPIDKTSQIPGSDKLATTTSSTRPSKATPKPTMSTTPPSQPVTAPPVPAQPAPPPKPGGTYWPESKKKALAEAARAALTSTPPNQGKIITTQEIHDLLDQDPSYTQMCEILEYRGFVIDRGQFARILLKAVPDLGSASTPPNAAPTNAANATHSAPADPTPTVTTSNNTITTTTTTAKDASATPTAGTFGKLVKPTFTDSAPQMKAPRPLPYSAPPVTAYQVPNGYVTPYASIPPGTERASRGSQSNGFPPQHRFVAPPPWTPDEARYHTSGTNYDRPNGSALNSHLAFSTRQQSESTHGQASDQNRTTYPNELVAHQPTKQEMARKRNFGEIVDLTQTMSDDEDLKRQRPKPRTNNETTSGPSKSVKNIFNQVAQRQQDSDRTTPKPFKYKYSGRDALLQSYDIVAPMNKRRDALRRSTYNPKTIARDVLLGLGKHPTMAPLNAHLDVLKDRFKAVDFESDLSAFRWDLVDPEGDPPRESSHAVDEEEAVVAVAPVTRQHPAPIAVMINGSEGDVAKDVHTLSPVVNSNPKPRQRGSYKKRGIRSDIQPIGSADRPERQPPQSSPHVRDMSKVSSTDTPDLSRFAYSSPYTAQTGLPTLNTSSSSTPGSISKNKGRPRGAKNKQVRPDKGISKKAKAPSMGETPSTAKAKSSEKETVIKTPSRKTLPVENSSIGESNASIPTRPRFNTTTPSRPSGLRNSISAITPTDGIAVVIHSRSPSVIVTPQASAKKSRPKKSEDLSDSTAPPYTVYRCHWENCPAELHSLETLKKHVRKHRRAVEGVYPCLWAGCFDSSNPVSNSTQNQESQHRRLKFKTDAEWVEHIDSNHIKAKWELSEGAVGRPSDAKASDRFSEEAAHGRRAVSKVKGVVVPVSPV